jgi:hypothetical protein
MGISWDHYGHHIFVLRNVHYIIPAQIVDLGTYKNCQSPKLAVEYLVKHKQEIEQHCKEGTRLDNEVKEARARVTELESTLSSLNRRVFDLQAQIRAANSQIDEPGIELASDGDYGAGQQPMEYVEHDDAMEVDVSVAGEPSPGGPHLGSDEPQNPVSAEFRCFLLSRGLHSCFLLV